MSRRVTFGNQPLINFASVVIGCFSFCKLSL